MSQQNDDRDITEYLNRVAEQEKPRLGGRNEQQLAHVKTENDRLLRRESQ
jgi:hypothetical protein